MTTKSLAHAGIVSLVLATGCGPAMHPTLDGVQTRPEGIRIAMSSGYTTPVRNPCKDAACHPYGIVGSWKPHYGDDCMLTAKEIAGVGSGRLKVVDNKDNTLSYTVEVCHQTHR